MDRYYNGNWMHSKWMTQFHKVSHVFEQVFVFVKRFHCAQVLRQWLNHWFDREPTWVCDLIMVKLRFIWLWRRVISFSHHIHSHNIWIFFLINPIFVGSYNIVKLLLNIGNVNVNILDDNGLTPLHVAAIYGQYKRYE